LFEMPLFMACALANEEDQKLCSDIRECVPHNQNGYGQRNPCLAPAGLQAEHKLDGLFDDRGKYVALTEGEYRRIAQFIAHRGRVSRADVAAEVNRQWQTSPLSAHR
jgi:hypothetical protein